MVNECDTFCNGRRPVSESESELYGDGFLIEWSTDPVRDGIDKRLGVGSSRSSLSD